MLYSVVRILDNAAFIHVQSHNGNMVDTLHLLLMHGVNTLMTQPIKHVKITTLGKIFLAKGDLTRPAHLFRSSIVYLGTSVSGRKCWNDARSKAQSRRMVVFLNVRSKHGALG